MQNAARNLPGEKPGGQQMSSVLVSGLLVRPLTTRVDRSDMNILYVNNLEKRVNNLNCGSSRQCFRERRLFFPSYKVLSGNGSGIMTSPRLIRWC
jgi:hypothetical protein